MCNQITVRKRSVLTFSIEAGSDLEVNVSGSK